MTRPEVGERGDGEAECGDEHGEQGEGCDVAEGVEAEADTVAGDQAAGDGVKEVEGQRARRSTP
jgi:hypothetical protein